MSHIRTSLLGHPQGLSFLFAHLLLFLIPLPPPIIKPPTASLQPQTFPHATTELILPTPLSLALVFGNGFVLMLDIQQHRHLGKRPKTFYKV